MSESFHLIFSFSGPVALEEILYDPTSLFLIFVIISPYRRGPGPLFVQS
jgi:hypothetical protein